MEKYETVEEKCNRMTIEEKMKHWKDAYNTHIYPLNYWRVLFGLDAL